MILKANKTRRICHAFHRQGAPRIAIANGEMPVPITGQEKAPEYINALMVNFRELIVGLEDESEQIRDKLASLKQRARNTQTPTTPSISTSTIPTDSTPPVQDVADYPTRARPKRCATLPQLPHPSKISSPPASPFTQQSSSSPPVRPPRQNDLLRKNLENIYSQVYRQKLARDKRGIHFTSRSKTMTSAAVSAAKSRGALIVLEGVDRVGKSTLAKKLVDHLEKLNCPVTHCRFPNRTTPVGQLIDQYLKSSSKQIDDHVLHLLFSANRWELSKRIRAALNEGTSVVVDRYAYSGIAYSSAKSGLPIRWSCETERGLPRPDLVIYLELKRDAQHLRDGFGDERFETEEMQDSVRLQYEQVMDLSKETWLKINVDNKKPDQVLAEVIMPVKRCLESAAIKELGTLEFFDITPAV